MSFDRQTTVFTVFFLAVLSAKFSAHGFVRCAGLNVRISFTDWFENSTVNVGVTLKPPFAARDENAHAQKSIENNKNKEPRKVIFPKNLVLGLRFTDNGNKVQVTVRSEAHSQFSYKNPILNCASLALNGFWNLGRRYDFDLKNNTYTFSYTTKDGIASGEDFKNKYFSLDRLKKFIGQSGSSRIINQDHGSVIENFARSLVPLAFVLLYNEVLGEQFEGFGEELKNFFLEEAGRLPVNSQKVAKETEPENQLKRDRDQRGLLTYLKMRGKL